MGAHDSLQAYRSKRDFKQTPEPATGGSASDQALTFVVQKHAARNLHYDFRLELQGTLKSWAVPKGPSLDPAVKRMGVHVEDHPIAYAGFEGTIPPRQYGAGHVIVWDRGLWTPIGDPVAGLKSGKLKFELHGEKLKGGWTLVRMHGHSDEEHKGHEPWLLIKEKDDYARSAREFDVLEAQPNSVLTGKPLPDAGSPAARVRKTGRMPDGARKAPLPATLAPQLTTLVERVPADWQDWLFEIKFDGYRLLTRIEDDSVRCMTRNGKDWTAKLPRLARAVAQLGIPSGWLDGEIVVMNDKGLPDFGALQNAFDSASTADIVYYVFDLPFYDGRDLRTLPLTQRRDILRTTVTRSPQASIRFSEAFEQAPQDLLASARDLGLEGLVGKRKDSVYTSRRSPTWIKLKIQLRQEFVVGGYTAPQGSRTGLGALLLGVHDADGKLRYAGNVGSGFDNQTLRDLKARLSKLHSDCCPFAELSSAVKGQWVKPQLLAEVAFSEWTAGGRIRHGVFQGLRTDKPARQIIRETAAMLENPHPAPPSPRITHPQRVIDTSSGFTKKDLVAYYATVAALILPHLKGRPTSLVRAPEGISGELFFQKHAEASSIPGIKLLAPELDPGHAPLLEIPTDAALLAAAQVNVLEFHTWNATARAIRKPDRMIFDLDPGEGVPWSMLQEAAQLVRGFLDELGLSSFLKTSGGKGLHIVVPLKRGYDFDTVKDFSHAIVTHLAGVIPQRFVAKSGPKNRVGKIFVDYLRNGFGATTVSAWSLRARPGLGVSVPVAWEELASLTGSAQWTATTITERIKTGNLPWQGFDAARCALSGPMKTLGFQPSKPGARGSPSP
jgi:bifunctional non-homologous end joining protein LigD